MARPVHYHAAGRLGLRFECYMVELRAHVAAYKIIDEARRARWREEGTAGHLSRKVRVVPPSPRCHSDLGKVNCLACWRAIYVLMPEVVSGRKT